MLRIAVMILLLIVAAATSADNGATSLSVLVERVTNRVMVARAPAGTNVVAIVTNDGVVIVDTHLSPATMDSIKVAIARELGREDFTHVINTHGHWDHCSGNQAFPDAKIIGHANAPAFMSRHRATAPGTLWGMRSRIERDRDRLAKSPENAEAIHEAMVTRQLILSSLESTYTVTPPALTFDDRYQLDLGEEALFLLPAGNGHSITDVFVYFAAERVLMTGDVFCSPTTYCFQASPVVDMAALLQAVDFALERGVETVIPGHGDVFTAEDLRALRDRLAGEVTRLSKAESAAQYLETLLQESDASHAVQLFLDTMADTSWAAYFIDEEFAVVGSRVADRGRVDDALTVFLLSYELFPDSPLICNRLADAYWASGDTLSAIDLFERGYELESWNRYAEAMLKILRGE